MRTDYDILMKVGNKLLEYSAITGVHIDKEETYGVDIACTGWGREFGVEVKSASEKYGSVMGDYFLYSSTTGDYWRWCSAVSQDNQDIISADTTERPSNLEGKHVMILNKSKLDKLLKTNQCLAYAGVDGFVILSPEQLKESILGFGYLYCGHTKYFYNRKRSFELKALINLDNGKFIAF